MCRAGPALLALALWGVAARAQQPRAPARALLARAESLWHRIGLQDSAAARETLRQRRARRFDAGAVTTLLPEAVGAATGSRVAAGAWAYVRDAVPVDFLAGRMAVGLAATDVEATVRAEGLGGRIRIPVGVEPGPDSLADGWTVAAELARSYRQTLDSTWRVWLPLDMGLAWTMRREGPEAVRELMQGETRAGGDCLAGLISGCRRWLGLDAAAPATRFRPAELRVLVSGRWFPSRAAVGLAHDCTVGSDFACLRLVALGFLPPIPAGPVPLASFAGYVRTRGPKGALLRALADRNGGVGDRFARAVGVPEDSLVRGWRSWVMTGGGQPRVTANLRDAWPAVLVAGLLILAASRSGRWR